MQGKANFSRNGSRRNCIGDEEIQILLKSTSSQMSLTGLNVTGNVERRKSRASLRIYLFERRRARMLLLQGT